MSDFLFCEEREREMVSQGDSLMRVVSGDELSCAKFMAGVNEGFCEGQLCVIHASERLMNPNGDELGRNMNDVN